MVVIWEEKGGISTSCFKILVKLKTAKQSYYFANVGDGQNSNERPGASVKTAWEEWGETLKNTTVCHAYIKFIQNYPFVQ